MTANETLAAVQDAGITLELAGDMLQYHGPPGSMTSDLRQALADNKSAIIAWLSIPPDVKIPLDDLRGWADERGVRIVGGASGTAGQPFDPHVYIAPMNRKEQPSEPKPDTRSQAKN